ncbi:MAG TPA: peptidoglycan editing factor PgeF [Chloroflexota bacterium]|nr:peptidoglycan editing factor PgeF [Chloroflexota bacterium]
MGLSRAVALRRTPREAGEVRTWPLWVHDERVAAGVAGRTGGVSPIPYRSLNLSVRTGDSADNVAVNRQRFLSAFTDDSVVVWGALRHGREVAVIDAFPEQDRGHEPLTFRGDAAVTNLPGLLLAATFADCVPVLFWDPETAVCGLAHAGWRGTVLRVASATVLAMKERWGSRPEAIRAFIGPSIGACCYTVGPDVVKDVQDSFGSASADLVVDGRFNLRRANVLDLTSAGLTPEHIEISCLCTSCRTDLFFSHRAEDGRTGRFGACIGTKSG